MFRITGTPPRGGETFMLIESGELAPVFGRSGAATILDAVDRIRPYPYTTNVQVLLLMDKTYPGGDPPR